jgi:hypothetical protein
MMEGKFEVFHNGEKIAEGTNIITHNGRNVLLEIDLSELKSIEYQFLDGSKIDHISFNLKTLNTFQVVDFDKLNIPNTIDDESIKLIEKKLLRKNYYE